jgi:hypothetical protein
MKCDNIKVRVFWFRNPLFTSRFEGGFESAGIGISAEFRMYFSDNIRGWHLGPFVEWVGYKWLGSEIYGNDIKKILNFGVQAGHRWISKHVSFDISARTAWFSPFSSETFPSGRFFPQKGTSHDLNSHLLVSVGYAF